MSGLRLDHLTVIAPSVEVGVAHVAAALGVEMSAGGRHPEMGTHNRLLRLGNDVFLEVIAVDPHAETPDRPRWFGLGDAERVAREWEAGRRLRAWVARTGDLDRLIVAHRALLAEKTPVSRGDRSWLFAECRGPAMQGLPSVIDWGERASPAPAMPDLGVRLLEFEIEHPDPDAVAAVYRDLAIVDPPKVRSGRAMRYSATIATPDGVRQLT